MLSTPTYFFGLTTYQSQLVLAGGVEAGTHKVTDQLLTSMNGKSWKPTLPPMPTKRTHCSAVTTKNPECIIVAGGEKSEYIPCGNVEVFLDNQWSAVQSLPKKFYDIKFTVHSAKIYLLGGFGQDHNMMYWCDMKTLVSTSKEALEKNCKPPPLWSRFTIPKCSSLVSYGQQLVAIGTLGGLDQTTVLAHFASNKVWVSVGAMPLELRNTVSVVLPKKNELVVIGLDEEAQRIQKRKVFKAAISSESHSSLSIIIQVRCQLQNANAELSCKL